VLQPRQATLDFGVAADNLRALTEIKGARDITSGVVLLVVLASAGRVSEATRGPFRRMLSECAQSGPGELCRARS
jgi:hypothetical protein